MFKFVYVQLNAKGKTFSNLGENKKASNDFIYFISSKCMIFTHLIEITIIIRYYSTLNL